MRIYAHIEAGAVKELVQTTADITTLYPSAATTLYPAGMTWVDVTDVAPQPQQRWTWDGTSFAAPAGPPAPTPAQVLAQALAALDTLSQAKQAEGVLFQASGASAPSLYPTDVASQAKIMGALQACGMSLWTDGTPWKATGAYVPLTAADVVALAKGAFAYVAACTTREAVLAAAVTANPAVDITGGWPSNTVVPAASGTGTASATGTSSASGTAAAGASGAGTTSAAGTTTTP